jgi:hypothetical protein
MSLTRQNYSEVSICNSFMWSRRLKKELTTKNMDFVDETKLILFDSVSERSSLPPETTTGHNFGERNPFKKFRWRFFYTTYTI